MPPKQQPPITIPGMGTAGPTPGTPMPTGTTGPPVEEVPFIGVPPGYGQNADGTSSYPVNKSDYFTHVEMGGGQRLTEPTFEEGAEFMVFTMTPAQLAALQRQLEQAGLLEPGSYSPGFVGPTDPTLDAVRVIMGFANQAGFRQIDDALRAYMQSGMPAVTAAQRAGEAPLPAPVSNPDDLRRVFKAAVIDTLGQGWSEAQINAMVEDYQAHERAYNASAAAGEAIEEQLPSAETFAMNQAKAAAPVEAQGQEFLGAANALTSMLGRWSP